MNSLSIVVNNIIPAMSAEGIDKVRELENFVAALPQIPLQTSHVLHAGVYSRTVTIPAGVTITGALIKLDTVLTISGEVLAYIGGETLELRGYNVIAASKNRKQAFFAKSDVHLTMTFASNATTVEEAENEFTDEGHLLCSRLPHSDNNITITRG